MKKTVLLRGPLLTHSGYGTHVRQLARWLFERYEDKVDIVTELLPWGQTPWIVDTKADLIAKIIQASSKTKPFYDVTIQVQLPNEWNPFLGKFNVGVTAGVETDRCNPQWIQAINRMQMVIVPSEFTKQCFENTGKITTNLVVIPEAFFDEILDDKVLSSSSSFFNDKLNNTLTSHFNFLVVGTLTGNCPENDRKNIPYTMKWFAEQFAGQEDVGLVIKTSMARQTHLDRMVTTNIFNKLLQEIGNPGPKFYLLHGIMDNESMAALYKHPKIKAIVSLSRGEGYCIPLLEAAASGLPVIATNWSGHLDFLSKGKFVKVDYKLDEIHESRVDGNIFMKGAKWAHPIESEAKKAMQKFFDKSVIPVQWASDLKTVIRKEYCFETIANKYDAVLGDNIIS